MKLQTSKRLALKTLKGFRDFLPEKMAIRQEVIRRLKNVFETYGFEELQTPALEYAEVLKGKYGEDAEKLMYLFKDQGDREVGLRYDLTVPFARVMASYQDLPKPFKRYQIQPAYRAENTQKGRYREFYQCDVDIVGSTSPLSDAEILGVINDALTSLEFPSFKIKVNSRQVLFTIIENAGIEKGLALSVIRSIDKLDKKSKEEVEQELKEKGLSQEKISKIFDPTLARGLDYYTGPIFETQVEEPKIGSVTGGGRYNQLLKTLGGPDLPATGTTIGLDRICDVIEELNLWNLPKTKVQVLVAVLDPKFINESLKVAQTLRERFVTVEVYPDENTKLDKQLKYADQKGVPFVLIIGEDEAKENKVTLKNMETGEQETLTLEGTLNRVKS